MRAFISYSHVDDSYRKALETHLALLRREGLLSVWTDRKILPGGLWSKEIDQHLATADLIIFLVSSDFIASDYCYGIEMAAAMKAHSTRRATVVPIIVRPTDWHSAPFGKLQALPKDAKPISDWRRRDTAYLDVAKALREVCKAKRDCKTSHQSISVEAFQFFPTITTDLVRRARLAIDPQASPWNVTRYVKDADADQTLFDIGCGTQIEVRRHELIGTTIPEIAVWRRMQYKTRLSHQNGSPKPEYGFTLFAIAPPRNLSHVAIETALLSCPSVLISRTAADEHMLATAREIEAEYLATSTIPSGCACFSYEKASTGYAHWAGIGYHPSQSYRAVSVNDLLSFEVVLQSLWVFSDFCCKNPEKIRDRAAATTFISMWGSHLLSPSGQEPTPHTLFRKAAVTTSHIESKLENAKRSLYT